MNRYPYEYIFVMDLYKEYKRTITFSLINKPSPHDCNDANILWAGKTILIHLVLPGVWTLSII